VVFIDGVSKPKAPGSLWEPAETSLGIPSPEKLAIAFGLFMAGVHSTLRSFRHTISCARYGGPESIQLNG